MKELILNLLDRKRLSQSFWTGPAAQVVVRPPAPKSLVISRLDDVITITEAHVSLLGWFTSPSHDDIEMRFRIDERGNWMPLSLKKGTEPARIAVENDAGAVSPKPIVAKRQSAFAARWAGELTIRGMLRGIVDEHNHGGYR